MKAIVTKAFGLPPEMGIEEREKPAAKPGYSVVKMRAATINQLSNFIRQEGIGGTKAPLILGNEGAGTIEESALFAPGAKVGIYGGNTLGIVQDGLFSEWVLVEDRRLFTVPDVLDFDEAATLSVNYLTAFRAMTKSVQVEKGQYVLISGATGSVGHALVQVALALGAIPVALVSTQAKAESARKAGAERVIVIEETQELATEVRQMTNGKGADYAFDPVGGALTGQLLQSVRAGGSVVSLGFTAGKSLAVDAFDIIAGEKTLVGYALHAEKDDDIYSALQDMMLLVEEGKLKPIIDTRVAMADFERGYQRLTSRQAIGSIVVQL
ncbi:TPA: zinc-binding alcohol dehydrogenase family protein [Enterobacter soli]|uniref:Zinc-binding alcohol dehydrogenase family protein n=1 Tax=Enterobacter soli TaxID=885040 RepID=A0AAW8H8W2_9ENTR|nr:zinc-binding alcohol dehydrogenase family protein [Enterobacter soli]MDQ2257395.1 zinc-binding alcohol dehydrogenase family protein [Enterobacter soli]MDQ2337478.1 zinc-binding alcohol dehydrogenase family protein [Enterobacter soli]HEE9788568.1 zinc-binding alcohol dehydrogenase family protein [Enterobacter soli]HEE9790862.1 zinc-binding alcohol dehydrogenase family protein [Enterobacter soli]